jgi:dihydrofolate reductase
MNTMPKYVVSTTLDRADWTNSTVIRGNVPEEVRKLQERVDGDILIAGSGRLVQALMQHDMIDEYRLMVYPIVLGSGKRLFGDTGEETALRLESSTKAGDCLIMTYRSAPTREASER